MKMKKMLLYTAPVALAGFIYLGEATGVGEVFAKIVTTVTQTETMEKVGVTYTKVELPSQSESKYYELIYTDDTGFYYYNVYTKIITETETQTEVPDDVVISEKKIPSQAPHIHSFVWTVTKEPTKTEDGLEEYRCKECGAVQASQPISMYMFRVKELYGLIKDAPQGGSVTYDFGDLVTFSDYLLTKLAERSDVTVTVQFTSGGEAHSLTFPAGTDYTSVLTDADQLYGFYGLAARLGLTVA